jgi:hypothetical protein
MNFSPFNSARILAENLRLQAAALDRVGHEPKVHLAARDLLIDLRRTPVFHMQLHVRIALPEGLQKGRQLVQADAVDGGDAEFPGDHVAQRVKAAVEVIEHAQDFAPGLEENAALRGQRKVPLAALDEPHLEALLDGANLLADGALGDGIERARLRETARLDKIAEDFEGIDMHA